MVLWASPLKCIGERDRERQKRDRQSERKRQTIMVVVVKMMVVMIIELSKKNLQGSEIYKCYNWLLIVLFCELWDKVESPSIVSI